VLVQVKNKCERSLPVTPPDVEKTSRLRSRDPVASRVRLRYNAQRGDLGMTGVRRGSWTLGLLNQ
jgi:hypothetical protein